MGTIEVLKRVHTQNKHNLTNKIQRSIWMIYLGVSASKVLLLGDVELCRRAGSLWSVDPPQHLIHNWPAHFYPHNIFQLCLLVHTQQKRTYTDKKKTTKKTWFMFMKTLRFICPCTQFNCTPPLWIASGLRFCPGTKTNPSMWPAWRLPAAAEGGCWTATVQFWCLATLT